MTVEEENKILKEIVHLLAGSLWRLDKYGYINAYEEADEAQCAHFLDIAREEVNRASELFNLRPIIHG